MNDVTFEDVKRLIRKHGAGFEIHLQANPRVARLVVVLKGTKPPYPGLDFPITGKDSDKEVLDQLRQAAIQTGLATEADTFALVSFKDSGPAN